MKQLCPPVSALKIDRILVESQLIPPVVGKVMYIDAAKDAYK